MDDRSGANVHEKGDNMAVYRKNWNGLTLLNPEVDTFPEDMELKVFPVPKRIRIQTVAVRKRSRRNTILKVITIAAAVAYFAAACTMQRPTIVAGIVIGASLAWMALFAAANVRRWK